MCSALSTEFVRRASLKTANKLDGQEGIRYSRVMKVDANGVELLPLTIDGILELLRQVDRIQNVLDNVIHVPIHKLVHKLFDLQIV